MLASAIGPVNAGIVGALEDAYLEQTGVVVRHVGVGTGAALEIGFGVDRRDLMYNDFVILGPAGDPARIRGRRRRSTLCARSRAPRPRSSPGGTAPAPTSGKGSCGRRPESSRRGRGT